MGLSALSAAVERAKAHGAWLVLTFHGIGGGHHMSCDLEVFDRFVGALACDDRVDVVTFLEGARRTRARSESHD